MIDCTYYDSTGILESLPKYSNWPFGKMAFIIEKRETLLPVAIRFWNCAFVRSTAKVNTIWDDIGAGGVSQVQNARKTFCDRYARKSKKPVRDIRQILINE